MNTPVKMTFSAVLFCAMTTVFAHHASAPHFDSSRPLQLEGVITNFRFVNPHAYVYFDVTDAEGNTVNWNCEMGAAAALMRQGWTADVFPVGMAISVDAIAARRDPHGCAYQSGTLADGTTIARSGQITRSDSAPALAAGAPASSMAVAGTQSLVGTWITTPRQRGGGGGPPSADRFAGLLTEAGQAAAAQYDERFDDPALECSPSSLIRGWSEPSGISEITRTDETLTIKHQFMDTVRTVDLTTREHPDEFERSLTGHSVGWFEDDVLVIDTVGFAAGVLLPHPGILHTEDMRIVERLSVSNDGTQLIREYEVTDPAYLTGPYTGTNSWTRTDLPLTPYNCTELSGINNMRPEAQ